MEAVNHGLMVGLIVVMVFFTVATVVVVTVTLMMKLRGGGQAEHVVSSNAAEHGEKRERKEEEQDSGEANRLVMVTQLLVQVMVKLDAMQREQQDVAKRMDQIYGAQEGRKVEAEIGNINITEMIDQLFRRHPHSGIGSRSRRVLPMGINISLKEE